MESNYENQKSGNKMIWIIIGVIAVIMIIGIVYGATQRTLKKQTTGDDSLITGKLNDVLLDENGQPILTNQIETPVTITSLDIVNLQTFPYRVQARIKAQLADGCSVGRTSVNQTGGVFTLSVTASKSADAICTTALTPYETVIDLPVTGLTAGTYTVNLGTIKKTFKLSSDNSVQYTGDK